MADVGCKVESNTLATVEIYYINSYLVVALSTRVRDGQFVVIFIKGFSDGEITVGLADLNPVQFTRIADNSDVVEKVNRTVLVYPNSDPFMLQVIHEALSSRGTYSS